MKLNISIIYDEVNNRNIKLVSNDSIERSLSGIRFLHSEDKDIELSENYLYILDGIALESISLDKPNLSFVSIGETDEKALVEQYCNAILFPNQTDIHWVFTQIEEIFEKYTQWENDILTAVASGAPSQTVFDMCALHLKNPIILIDNLKIVVMTAGIIPADINSPLWSKVLAKGYFSPDGSYIENKRISERIRASSKPLMWKHSPDAPETFINAILYHEGAEFGCLATSNLIAPLTVGQHSLFYCIQNIMELAMKSNLSSGALTTDIGAFIDRIIHGHTVENSTVLYFLNRLNWRIYDKFRLLFIYRYDGRAIDKTGANLHISTFKDMIGSAVLFPYDNGILCIQHADKEHNYDGYDSAGLQKYLERLEMCCAVSMDIDHFLSIQNAYVQCTAVKEHAKERSAGQIVPFIEIMDTYLIKSLASVINLRNICNMKILQIYETDINGKDFVRSLQAYLINGRNITAAAKSLCIHRNTLIYRLNRMESLLGLNFSDINESTLFMLHISCLIVPYLHE